MPDSSTRRSGVSAMAGSYAAGQSTPPARSIASSAIRLPDSMCVRTADSARASSPASKASTMARCSRARYSPPSSRPPPDHLHHQVHRELPVEPGQHRVAGQVDLVLVERRVRGVPFLLRDRGLGRLHENPKADELRTSDRPDRARRRVQLERQPDVVALDERGRRHGRHVVAAARLDRQQPLGDEARERVVDGAARDTELGRELVQAELGPGAGIAPEHALPRASRRPARSGSCAAASSP